MLTRAVSRPRRLGPATATAWRWHKSIGTCDGIIIATIIGAHIPTNETIAARQDCPGIRIHAIDIVQPPCIRISPIADMEFQQSTVTIALTAKSSAETPIMLRWEASINTNWRPVFLG